jgi:hypothetical protein
MSPLGQAPFRGSRRRHERASIRWRRLARCGVRGQRWDSGGSDGAAVRSVGELGGEFGLGLAEAFLLALLGHHVPVDHLLLGKLALGRHDLGAIARGGHKSPMVMQACPPRQANQSHHARQSHRPPPRRHRGGPPDRPRKRRLRGDQQRRSTRHPPRLRLSLARCPHRPHQAQVRRCPNTPPISLRV